MYTGDDTLDSTSSNLLDSLEKSASWFDRLLDTFKGLREVNPKDYTEQELNLLLSLQQKITDALESTIKFISA